MEYIQLMYVFLFAVVGFYGTKGEFTSWKEPPIDSGIGEGNASVVVKENGLPGTRTGIKLQALGGTGNISYVLKQQNPLYFSIGGPAGDEVTIASPVDYEQLTEVTVTVIAVDHGSPQMTGSAKMTIFIGDVNDNRPVFQKNLYTVTLPELTDTGTDFLTVTAMDADGSYPNNQVSYSIAGGNTDNTFAMNSTTGQLYVAQQLSYSKAPSYIFIVTGVDGGIVPLTGTTTVECKIAKVESFTSWKEPPISDGIGYGTATVMVKENSTPGTSTGIKLQALGGNGTVSYTIKDRGQPQYFSIGGPNMDDVIVTRSVDFETHPNLTVIVQAADSGVPSKTGRAIMTILIDDVNDNAPVFNQTDYAKQISETAAVGTTLITVYATDNDGTAPNNEVTYALNRGNTNNMFNISRMTGEITIAKDLTMTRPSTHMFLTVLAIDGGTGSTQFTASTTVSISISREPASTTPTARVPTTTGSGSYILAPCMLTILTSWLLTGLH